MSLDVYLTLKGVQNLAGQSVIFIREDGEIKQVSREEWDMRFPSREPVVTDFPDEDDTVYDANITHNLGNMAEEAGIYQHLWRPEELDIKYANQLIEPLKAGLELLESDPARFEKFNPANGWGDYDGLVRFVRKYLEACEKYPEAIVSVWR